MLKTIILTLSAGFMIIGMHQTITVGFGHAYWIFMLSISLLLLYKLKSSEKR